MNKTARHALSAAAVLACAMGVSAPAHAQFFATICNDLQCTGGDDISFQDNAAGDTVAATGAISFSTAAFGYSFLVNTSQSKPMLGSAAEPQLDLSFAVTSTGTAGNVFIYTSDTGFTRASGSALLTLGGTNSGASNRHRPRLGRHEQYRAAVLGRQPHRLARRPDRPDVRRQRDQRVRVGRQSVFADDRHADHARIRWNELREPEPAGLGDSRAEHLGVDLHGSGPGRLRPRRRRRR